VQLTLYLSKRQPSDAKTATAETPQAGYKIDLDDE
jgi:hypothetical protein